MNLRNFSKRCCPKCGSKVGVIKRDLSFPRRDRMHMIGCKSGIHIQQPDTWGYDLLDFPLAPTRQILDAELNVCGNAKAPAGWYCSRQAGHAGPCAARRIVGFKLRR